MNAFEHFFCSTSLWRRLTHRHLLPWVFSGANLGDHVLEIGAGSGPATAHLLQLAPQVTSLEYNERSIAKLKSKNAGLKIAPVCADAAQLPFADQTFSSAVAILVLHHLKSKELQNRALDEVHRVLRPGGSFFVFEINDDWIHRVGHYKSTFTPLTPGSAFARLTTAGFSKVSVDFRRGGFRIRARKAAGASAHHETLAAASATA
jgi:ubiquinone/menaquinone biosynthesis C-methylase UbiE